MLATNIAKHESDFLKTGRDSAGKLFELTDAKVSIKGTTEEMSYINCRCKNEDSSFYYKEKILKNQIVLHFTAGYLKGDVAALTQPNYHVSTPFLIARNGEIINLWSPDYWAYHLGVSAVGGNRVGSKRTIAIELSNIGYLNKNGDKLVTSYSDIDTYCTLSEKEYYTHLEKPYRGQEYYATFTDAQYDSLVTLLRYLTAEFRIPRAFLEEDKRDLTGERTELENFRGITSHVNYRASGKWDIGPAFDWERVIRKVKEN